MKRIAEKIETLKNKRGLNTSELAKLAGIGNTTLADILKGRTARASIQTIGAIAKALDCTMDYLMNDDAEDRYLGETYPVNRYEYEHIKAYRQISATGQQYVDNMTNNLIGYEQAIKTQIQALDEVTATKETIQVYWAKAAAGIPLPVVTDGYDLIEKNVTVPAGADFGVVLSGDSMEPKYPDNTTVWVKAQRNLEHGDIGVFMINGETTCKEFYCKDGVCKLVSLNKKYDDIILNECNDVRVAGKVIGHN